jgi:hypothetical protein
MISMAAIAATITAIIMIAIIITSLFIATIPTIITSALGITSAAAMQF